LATGEGESRVTLYCGVGKDAWWSVEGTYTAGCERFHGSDGLALPSDRISADERNRVMLAGDERMMVLALTPVHQQAELKTAETGVSHAALAHDGIAVAIGAVEGATAVGGSGIPTTVEV
jgi:hypothetical protein